MARSSRLKTKKKQVMRENARRRWTDRTPSEGDQVPPLASPSSAAQVPPLASPSSAAQVLPPLESPSSAAIRMELLPGKTVFDTSVTRKNNLVTDSELEKLAKLIKCSECDEGCEVIVERLMVDSCITVKCERCGTVMHKSDIYFFRFQTKQ